MTEFCIELTINVGTTMGMELKDHTKATYHYLSWINRKWNQKTLLEEEIEVLLGVCANNDPSKSDISTMTQVLADFGCIDLSSACGLGQMLLKCKTVKTAPH